jgi:O-antigen/teichoic acid export membrane protein
LRYLRFRRFDTATSEGRADERYRLATLAIIANVLNRGLGMLVLLAGVALSLPYLGPERLGVWMTVASLVAVLSFMDLGIGNAMVAAVAEHASAPRGDALAGLITRGLLLLAGIGALMGGLLWTAASTLPTGLLFRHLSPGGLAEAQQVLMLFSALFALSVPAQAVQKIYAGLQLAWIAHLVMAIASLLSLILIVAATRAQARLPVLLLATLGVQLAGALVLLGRLWLRHLVRAACLRSGLRETARFLVRRGGLYFWLQIGALAGWGVDGLLVSSRLDVAEVSTLTIVQRMFDFVAQPLAIMNAPLWAAYADASARRDHAFIAHTLHRSMRYTAVTATLGVTLLVVAYPTLLRLWLHEPPAVALGLVAAVALWTLIQALASAWAMYMNGCSLMRPQVLVVVPFACLSLALKWWWLPRLGLIAIPLATAASYLLCSVVPYLTVFRRTILAPVTVPGNPRPAPTAETR